MTVLYVVEQIEQMDKGYLFFLLVWQDKNIG